MSQNAGAIVALIALSIVVGTSSVSLFYFLRYKVSLSEWKEWKTSSKYYFVWIVTAIISLGALLSCTPMLNRFHFETDVYVVGVFSNCIFWVSGISVAFAHAYEYIETQNVQPNSRTYKILLYYRLIVLSFSISSALLFIASSVFYIYDMNTTPEFEIGYKVYKAITVVSTTSCTLIPILIQIKIQINERKKRAHSTNVCTLDDKLKIKTDLEAAPIVSSAILDSPHSDISDGRMLQAASSESPFQSAARPKNGSLAQLPLSSVTEHADFMRIISTSKLVVVDFQAEWFVPCQNVASNFEKLAEAYPSVQFVNIDVDQNRETAVHCLISSLPAFLFFKNGKKIAEIVGTDIKQLEKMIKKQCKGNGSGTIDRRLVSSSPSTKDDAK